MLAELLHRRSRALRSKWNRTVPIFASLNESDHGFDLLQKAYENRDYNLFRLRVDPRLESLHKDPHYADLLRRIGLPQ